jgi:hypothetical protein
MPSVLIQTKVSSPALELVTLTLRLQSLEGSFHRS